ncbi:MAG: polysaccharide pyruvyl transferase family protein [Pseudobacteriovorax sp.]|nr:polysaccharide pyruvyl transferase family protein [Opitutales bacterium]NRA69215.1 polysaccharide pyruvyl transferase family protein [Pseudobacteriovorax sp.]
MITILDTSIASENLGDQIIMDAVKKQLSDIFPLEYFVNVATHDYLGVESKKMISKSNFSVVGGTNLLSANMKMPLTWQKELPVFEKIYSEPERRVNQWKLEPRNADELRNIILMAVGWWQYQKTAPNEYTTNLLKNILHKAAYHSVRDGYTLEKLKSVGISNVLNTGCVTMWGLDADHMAEVSKERKEEVVTTITFYKPHKEADSRMLRILKQRYKKTYLWIQGGGDLKYAKSLDIKDFELLPPSLAALDSKLSSGTVDYVGTRLHAGVRALQHKCLSAIVSVDNRATEIAKETGLPVVERLCLEKLKGLLDSPYRPQIDMPWANIDKYKKSLREAVS